jgi:polar amino acid transport system permease protein
MATNSVSTTKRSPVSGLHLGDAHVVSLKHPGRWVAVALIALVFASFIYTAITNPRFRWDLVFGYLFTPQILAGLAVTLTLTVIAMAIGLVLGTVVALMRLSPNPVLKYAGFTFVWLVRGIPLLVQLIFWYNLSALFPVIKIGIPFGGPAFANIDANTVMTAWTAAILGLGLNQAAYMAEIIRGGIQSVDEGQLEAASTIALSRSTTIRTIILPQAVRVIIPPTGNETITMLKTTSLVSVVAVADLLYSTQLIYARTFQTIPMLIMVSIWYLFLVSLLSFGQSKLERYFARGTTRKVVQKKVKRHTRGRHFSDATGLVQDLKNDQQSEVRSEGAPDDRA